MPKDITNEAQQVFNQLEDSLKAYQAMDFLSANIAMIRGQLENVPALKQVMQVRTPARTGIRRVSTLTLSQAQEAMAGLAQLNALEIEHEVPNDPTYLHLHINETHKIHIRRETPEKPEQYKIFLSDKNDQIIHTDQPITATRENDVFHFTSNIGASLSRANQLERYGVEGVHEVGTAIMPRGNQSQALSALIEDLRDNPDKILKGGSLFLMGTGTGKTILQGLVVGVTAGLPNGGSIMVVPTDDLAGDAIKDIKGVLQPGYHEKIERFAGGAVIDPNKVMVMTAAELQTHCRSHPPGASGALNDRRVLIDEVHQWSYKQENVTILTQLLADNKVHGVTATPDPTLVKLFGKAVCDINLNGVMSQKGIRWLKETAPLVNENRNPLTGQTALQDAVINYHTSFTTLTSANHGYFDIAKKLDGVDNDEQRKALVIQAIKQNLYCAWDGKNFAFSSDPADLTTLQAMYNGQVQLEPAKIEELREKLTSSIGAMCDASGLSGDAKAAFVQERVENVLKTNQACRNDPQVMFREELSANISRLAYAMLTDRSTDQVRTAEQTGGAIVASKYTIEDIFAAETYDKVLDKLKKNYTGLTEEEYTVLAHETLSAMHDRILGRTYSIPEAEVDYLMEDGTTMQVPNVVAALGAEYAVRVEKPAKFNTPAEQARFNAQIDSAKAKLRLGLCHHVLNNGGLDTGVSIQDVLSTQFIATGNSVTDPLNNAEKIAQIAGRPIRTGWGVAFMQCFGQEPTLDPLNLIKLDANDHYLAAKAKQREELMESAEYFAEQITTALQSSEDKLALVRDIIGNKILNQLDQAHGWDTKAATREAAALMTQVSTKLSQENQTALIELSTTMLSTALESQNLEFTKVAMLGIGAAEVSQELATQTLTLALKNDEQALAATAIAKADKNLSKTAQKFNRLGDWVKVNVPLVGRLVKYFTKPSDAVGDKMEALQPAIVTSTTNTTTMLNLVAGVGKAASGLKGASLASKVPPAAIGDLSAPVAGGGGDVEVGVSIKR